MWLLLSYIGVIIIARVLTSVGRPRRTWRDVFRALLDPTFHLLAWTSLAALALPAAEYIIFRPATWLPLNFAGAALIVSSGMLALAANRALGAGFTPYVDRRVTAARIVTAGPYRYVRHPLYTAGFMLTAGAALMLSSRLSWFFTALCWLAIVWRTVREERLLTKNMDGYVDYKRRTKRYIPGVW